MDSSKLINPDIEAIVLGSALIQNETATEVISELEDHDFSKLEHKIIFRAIKQLTLEDHHIEPLTVISKISEGDRKVDEIYILELTRYGVSSGAVYEIERLKELSRMRRLLAVTSENQILIEEGKEDSEEISSKIIKEVETIMTEGEADVSTFESAMFKDYLGTGEPYWKYLEKRMEMARQGVNVIEGVPSFYPRLDTALNGFNQGHFVVIGARPGAGKTTFVLNLIHNICFKNKVPALFFSLEMSAVEVYLNLSFIKSRVPSQRVRSNKATAEDFRALIPAMGELKDMPLFVDESSSMRISKLVAKAKKYVRTNGVKIIFIDYLTLITGDGKYSSREEQVSEISKTLRAMAKKLKVPVVVICQLNRASENENRKPKKSDLRESGQVEQDAHVIMMLSKKEIVSNALQDKEEKADISEFRSTPKAPLVDLIRVDIVKNRFGPTQEIIYSFHKDFGLFEEHMIITDEDRNPPPGNFDEFEAIGRL